MKRLDLPQLGNNKHLQAGRRGEENAEAVLANVFVFYANRFSSYSPISWFSG
jgi:hypothetical protein